MQERVERREIEWAGGGGEGDGGREHVTERRGRRRAGGPGATGTWPCRPQLSRRRHRHALESISQLLM